MELTIEKLVYGGDGLTRLPADERGPGKAVFVPFVLDGEKVDLSLVEQKRGFARGQLQRVIQPSLQRIEPHCPYFQHCGGCHYQHTSYEHQLGIKAAILKENLRRIARLELDADIDIHPSPPWNYRNRTRLKLRTMPDFALGFFKFNSHDLLPVEQCPISSPLINRAIAELWKTSPAQELGGVQEVELFTNADDTQLLIEAYCAHDIPKATAQAAATALRKVLPEVLGAVAFTGGTNHQPVHLATVGAGDLTYRGKHASYRVSAGAFFQVNRHLTDELVTLVTQSESGRTALDLYAGVGLFSTVLSREFERVIAVEASPISYSDLQYNSPANVKAVRAMSEQYLKNVTGKLQPDLVVVDPPRSGLGESVIHSLATMGAPRVTYVSCDPATLSRDLGRLLAAGYKVRQAHLVDLFPQTYHLESVFHLVR